MTKFSLQYTTDRLYLLDFEINKIFRKYLNIFKQVNIKNFVYIGDNHALILNDYDLKESIILTCQIYEEWTRYVSSRSQEDESYRVFRQFFISSDCYLAKLPENIAYGFNDKFDYDLVEQTIAMTYNYEYPDIVDCILKEAKKKKTLIERLYFRMFYSDPDFYNYKLKEELVLSYNQNFLEQLSELIDHLRLKNGGYITVLDIDVPRVF